MDFDIKKTVLRMIPYGIYVLTAKFSNGDIAAATVNWATQTSFDPPLVALGVKADSAAYQALSESGQFTLNFLGKDQQGAAFAFFKPFEVGDGTISGEAFREGDNGAPILESAPAAAEFRTVDIVRRGDHHIVVGEVTAMHANSAIDGRPDKAGLHMSDLGESVFYSG